MKNLNKEKILDLLKLLAVITLVTLMGFLFRRLGFPETTIVVVYILAVLLVSLITSGYVFGIASAVVSLFCYNYFFTLPYHTLAVSDPSYFITFVIMLVTSFITSTLTAKEKMLRETAAEKNEETQILYALSSSLSDASDPESVSTIAAESLSRLLQSDVGFIYLGGQLSSPVFIQTKGSDTIHRMVRDTETIRAKLKKSEGYAEDDEGYLFPIEGREHLLAAVSISGETEKTTLDAKRSLLLPIFENIAMALDRIEITEERAKVRETMERERERANLLRAISHDLRTPLSGIMGTSEMLMDMTDKDDRRQLLLKGIYQDADWLKNLVENILSLTRLQDGRVVPHKEMEAMEEIIGSAVAHVEKSLGSKRIVVETPMDFKLVPMDAKLVEQVVYNLLDNAIKHTKDNEEVKVVLSYTSESAVVSVLDQGEGIMEEDIPHLFDIFYTSRTRSADVKKGIGLGLTICRTVIGAHGGTIKGENRKDGKGAVFTFSLPLGEVVHG